MLAHWATFLRSYGAIPASDSVGITTAPQLTIQVRSFFDPSTCRHASQAFDRLQTAVFGLTPPSVLSLKLM